MQSTIPQMLKKINDDRNFKSSIFFTGRRNSVQPDGIKVNK